MVVVVTKNVAAFAEMLLNVILFVVQSIPASNKYALHAYMQSKAVLPSLAFFLA